MAILSKEEIQHFIDKSDCVAVSDLMIGTLAKEKAKNPRDEVLIDEMEKNIGLFFREASKQLPDGIYVQMTGLLVKNKMIYLSKRIINPEN